jgi:small conductance mechanosensitive channel
MQEFFNNLITYGTDLGLKILACIVVLIVGRIVIKWSKKLMTKSRFAKKTDPTVVTVLSHFVSAALYVLLVVIVIGILGIPTASIVAVIASAGVAIGLALQGALSNIAGGIMILILRPFKVGNFVDIGGFSGTVTDIGIFYTVLTTGDNKVVTIPNGNVMSGNVINYSTKETRRVDFVFGVAYGTDVDRVVELLLEEANKHELVLKDPAPFVRVSENGESKVTITARVWTKNSDYWTVYFDVLENVKSVFEAAEIEVPYNRVNVHIDND